MSTAAADAEAQGWAASAASALAVRAARIDEMLQTGLLAELDAELLARYPGEPVNGVEPGAFEAEGGHFVLAFIDGALAGCGAFRPCDDVTVELKRMYVRKAHRGAGIGRAIVAALEAEAVRRGFRRCILETAQRMPEAIAMYRRCGYRPMPPYGPFVGSARSVCMTRDLTAAPA
jgi:putative acetyltransferase